MAKLMKYVKSKKITVNITLLPKEFSFEGFFDQTAIQKSRKKISLKTVSRIRKPESLKVILLETRKFKGNPAGNPKV